jgi:hypothetical protein
MSWDRRTIFEQGAEDLMEQEIQRDPTWMPLIIEIRKNLREGYYAQHIVDTIGQRTSRTYTYVDAYIFGRIWCGEWLQGRLGSAVVSAGDAGEDSGIKENQETLNAHLHEHFRASVEKRIDSDGVFRWIKPIELTLTVGEPNSVKQTSTPWICPPGAVPLEIGTTTMARTFAHLQIDGGIARWPYGHDRVTVLKTRAFGGMRGQLP